MSGGGAVIQYGAQPLSAEGKNEPKEDAHVQGQAQRLFNDALQTIVGAGGVCGGDNRKQIGGESAGLKGVGKKTMGKAMPFNSP